MTKDPSENRTARSSISRRQFVGRSALMAGGLAFAPAFLAACGSDDDSSDGGGGDSDLLRISNWPLYISPGFNEAFTKETGIKVRYDENFQDNETWFAANKDALEAGQDIGADLVVPGNFITGRLIKLGWLDELDKENIPNISNIRPDLLDGVWDPGAVYSLPYMSGLVGIAYNTKAFDEPVTSLDALWDPAAKGKVTLFSDVQDSLGMIMMSQGKSPANPTVADVQAAADLVREQNDKGQIRRFTGNDYGEDLVSGNVVVAQVYSGDVAQLQADNPDIEFVLPDTGGTMFVDTMVIPTTTQNKAGAEAWMNFVYDKDNYAELIAEIQYIPVLSDMNDALAAVDPELVDNVLVNPPVEVTDRAEAWAPLEEADEQEMARIYSEVTGG